MKIKKLILFILIITIFISASYYYKDYIKEVFVINNIKKTNDFNKLKTINKNTVSYIKINGTKVDYPIVQTKDNDYYLKHSFDKSENKYGWIFMDYRNNLFNDRHTIIYGHTIGKNLMFATLNKILDNPNINKIEIYEDGEFKTYLIYSIYIIEPVNDYLRIMFEDETYKAFLEETKKRSLYQYDIKPKVSDKLLTLSTCYMEDERLVIHAIRE